MSPGAHDTGGITDTARRRRTPDRGRIRQWRARRRTQAHAPDHLLIYRQGNTSCPQQLAQHLSPGTTNKVTGTKIYLNTSDPWSLRDRVVGRLEGLRADRLIAPMAVGRECPTTPNRLMYNPVLAAQC